MYTKLSIKFNPNTEHKLKIHIVNLYAWNCTAKYKTSQK